MASDNFLLYAILIVVALAVQVTETAYLGCHKENRRRRTFTRNPGALKSGTVTPDRCMSICGGLKYSHVGLTAGKYCFCAQLSVAGLAALTIEVDAKCVTACVADTSVICGSDTHVSVYESIAPIQLSVSASQHVAQTGVTEVTFIPDVQTDGPGWSASFDYDDDAGRTDTVPNASGLLMRTFHQAGVYSVGTYATNPDGTLPEVTSGTSVLVQTSVGTVATSCEANMATYEEYQCTVVVDAGTDMQVTVTYPDGTAGPAITSSFPIADAPEYGLGNPVQENLVSPVGSGTMTSGLAFQLGLQAAAPGTLRGFEYFAANTGTLAVHVYRPDCSAGGQAYCYDRNDCVAPGACQSACAALYCTESIACCEGPPVRNTAMLDAYTHVYSDSITVSTPGPGYHAVAATVAIEPGDVIAHEATAVMILAVRGGASLPDYYCAGVSGGGSVSTALVCVANGAAETHYLKAIYSAPSSVLVPVFFHTSGTVTFTATMTNRESAIAGSQTGSSVISVMNGINMAAIDMPACVETGVPATFAVLPFTGDAYTIVWTFGAADGSDFVDAPATTLTHTYTLTGIRNITVNISNALSYKWNSTELCVEDRIDGLSVSTPAATVEVGVATDVTLGMTGGSDYTCTLQIVTSGLSQTATTTSGETPPNTAYPYTFTSSGDYTVTAVCANNINLASSSITLRAVERLAGMALSPAGAIANSQFQITVVWASGTDVTLTVTYDGVAQTMTVDEATRQAVSTQKTETSTTTHTVGYTASNVINTLSDTAIPFYIEIEITNPTLVCTFTSSIPVDPDPGYVVIPTGASVTCDANMVRGTSAVVTFHWADGTPDDTHTMANLAPWAGLVSRSHTFTTPTLCHMYVQVENAFNSHRVDYHAMVMTGVDNVVLNTPAPVGYTPPGIVTFIFAVTSGQPPNGVTLVMDWGDKHTDTITDFDVLMSITHSYYDMAGELTATYMISNLISEKDGTVPVQLVTPILDPEVFTNPVAASVNVPVDLVYKTRRGPGAGILDLLFDCDISDSGSTDGEGPRTRQQDSPDGEDVSACTYTAVGTYPALVTATSLFESVSTPHDVIVQHPVTDQFTVATNAPADYLAVNCLMQYELVYTGTPVPTDASIDWDYGDGTTETVSFATTTTADHTYAVPGHYTTTLTIYNLASSVTISVTTLENGIWTVPSNDIITKCGNEHVTDERTGKSGCYEDFGAVTMNVLRRPNLPLDSPDLPGYGSLKDRFRIDEDLRIHTTLASGTFVWWEVTATSVSDVITCNSSDINVITMNIPVKGVFTIYVTAMNLLHTSTPLSYTATFIEPSADVTVSDSDVITVAQETKYFDISFSIYGTTMCVVVDNGVDTVLYLYGDSATCATNAIIWDAGQHDASVDVTAPFTVGYVYPSEGTYNMEVTGFNEYSKTVDTIHFVVTGVDCSSPKIDIQDKRSDFRNPASFKKGDNVRIVGVTGLTCPETLDNVKRWTVKRWDDNTNEAVSDVDMASVSSAVNAELFIQRQSLPYGLLRLNYNVQMNSPSASSGERFYSDVQTFIRFVKSDLVVQVFENGMSLKTVGPAQVVSLSPRAFSYDPDVASGEPDVFDRFTIKCRDVTNGEVYDDVNWFYPVNVTNLPASHVDLGGCFRYGAGWLNDFSGSVTYKTDIMKPNHKYEIVVFGYKDTRVSYATAYMEVTSADPPDANIQFKIPTICKPNPEGKVFNPNSQLGLVAIVRNPCTGCTYTYNWEVFAFDYNYVDVSDGWRPLTYLSTFIEGVNSEEMTIHTGLYLHYATVDKFQLRLLVTDTSTSATGKAYMNLIRNNPPDPGSCSISPTSGKAASTNHTIQCSGFTDSDGIADYNVICTSGAHSYTVATGLDQLWEYVKLPMGDPDNGYMLSCHVRVYDRLGAGADYAIADITEELLPVSEMKEMFAGMATSMMDVTDVVAATANLNTVSSLAISYSSTLEMLSKSDERTEYAGVGTAESYLSTGLDDSTERYGAFGEPDADKEALLEYEEGRDTIVQVSRTLITGMAHCTLGSPQNVVQMSTAMAAISKQITYINRESQTKLTDIATTTINTFEDFWQDYTVEQTQSLSEGLFSTLQSVEEAQTVHGEHPSNADLRTQDSSVPYFSSNMDTGTPDVAMTDDPDEVLRQGKKILNKEKQVDFMKENQKALNAIKNKVVTLVSRVKPKSDIPTRIETDKVEVMIMKNSGKNVAGHTYSTGGGTIALPPIEDLGFDTAAENETLVFVSMSTANAPFTESSGNNVGGTFRTQRFKFQDENGNEKKITGLKSPIPITIARDPNSPADDDTSDFKHPEIVDRPDEYLFYQTMSVTATGAALFLNFTSITNTSGNQLLVLVWHQADPLVQELPDVESGRVDAVFTIPSHTDHDHGGFRGDATTPDPYTCFVDSDVVGGRTGTWNIGVRQMQPAEFNMYTDMASLPTTVPDDWKDNKKFYQDYKLQTNVASCAYADDDSVEFKTDGLKVGRLSTRDNLQCMTTHLTTFAGGWVVAPNTIDWNFVFSNADFFKNPTLYITEIVIVVVYILAMIWARRQDHRDLQKLGLAPLLDNDPKDRYYYEVLVSTGMRRNGGTHSKVHFILSGEEDETEVRTFTDFKRKIFERGNLDGFLMSVPSELGPLMYMRIWHDNSGKGKCASWYLNHIVIRDIQTNKKYFFITNRWFAVEEDDGQIFIGIHWKETNHFGGFSRIPLVDRVVPVAGKEQMTQFGQLFSEHASKNLTDGHLWFSVVARPPQSRFTRVQRVSCCLCLLFMSMLANAMFYQTATSSGNAYSFGPFALTPEQIFIGIASNLLIFPITFLIITLFRKSKPRKLRPSRIEEALKAQPERSTSMTDVNPRMKSSMSVDRPGTSFLMDAKRTGSSLSRPDTSLSTAARTVPKPAGDKKSCQLPWWFRIVAWLLLASAVLVSAFFVTMYGIMFEDTKCKKWITSMLISFFTSVFLTQPIKVFLFAIVFSLIIKNPGGEEDEEGDEEECRLEADEEYLHQEDEGFGFVAPKRAMYKPKPPDPKLLEVARQQRMKEIHMWSVIREILFYAFFLWILMVISYKSVSNESYRYKYSMEQVFIHTNDTNYAFTKVSNVVDFWIWAQSGMLRGLRAGPYYNNYPPFYLRGYINDKVSRLMGYAILRQVRVRPDTCTIPRQMDGVIDECNAPYSISHEEQESFGAGWLPLAGANSTREEYEYRSGDSLNSYPYWGEMAVYGGGGYVVRLNADYFDMVNHFKLLEDEKWVDEHTRAVFLEFTVYNPSINLFSVSTLVSEFRPSGGVFPSYRFEPCMLLPYMSSVLLFQIACEIVYLLFTVWFVIKLIKSLYKERLKYFRHFWNGVELCICAMSVTAIVIYFYRLVEVNKLTAYFKETHGNEYMKFQYVGYWSEIFSYIIGTLVFFATMKFLKLLRFNKRISLLADVLKNSGKSLIHFSIIFNIVFLAFVQLFYLVYVSNLDTFRSFVRSCENGIVMMMGKFDIYKMLAVNHWFTQIFIFLFVVTITFIVVNMFLSILNETFAAVRNNTAKQQNDYEIVDFMLKRFKMWTGLGGAASTTISPAEMEAERTRNYRTIEGQIEYFPNQIDRFLQSISNMYMEKAKFDDFLSTGMYGKMAMKARMAAPPGHPVPGPSMAGPSIPRPNIPGPSQLYGRSAVPRPSHTDRGMTDVHTD